MVSVFSISRFDSLTLRSALFIYLFCTYFENVFSAKVDSCLSKRFKTKHYAEKSHNLDMEVKTKTFLSNIGLPEQEMKLEEINIVNEQHDPVLSQ